MFIEQILCFQSCSRLSDDGHDKKMPSLPSQGPQTHSGGKFMRRLRTGWASVEESHSSLSSQSDGSECPGGCFPHAGTLHKSRASCRWASCRWAPPMRALVLLQQGSPCVFRCIYTPFVTRFVLSVHVREVLCPDDSYHR